MIRFFFLILLAPASVVATDPLECVDPDFVRGFLTGPGSTRHSFSTDIPNNFVIREPLSDFAIVGSRTQANAITVVVRSERSAPEAHAALLKALTSEGWDDITYENSPSRRGFQLSKGGLISEFCRDDSDSRVLVQTRERSGRTFIAVEQYDRKTLRGCLRDVAERQRTLQDQLPVLRPPAHATTSKSIIVRNGYSVSTGVDAVFTGSRKDFLADYESQVARQGWELQTRWSSEHSSGSVWSQEAGKQGLLIGTLQVINAGGGEARVRFSVEQADPSKDADDEGVSQLSGSCG